MRTNLSLITTEELVDELKNRFDACLFHGCSKRTNDSDFYWFNYNGLYATVIGLCDIAKQMLVQSHIKEYIE